MDVLINKKYRNYDYFSRYSSFPYYYNTIDSREIYGTTAQLNLNVPYIEYLVSNGDTWDSIALQYYNSPSYYWVLLDFNRLNDPFVEPKVGQVIKIPTLNILSYGDN